jgi:acyl transferase domain-containing protein/acyl-CoA synthetase (AMP-forming)/AMP-acid ligase II/acyl carrier protein
LVDRKKRYFREDKTVLQEKEFSSLAGIIQFWAEKTPEKIALTFLDEKENETESLSYRQLNERAKAIAAELISRKATGERVLLLYEPCLEFVCAFLGCLYAGAIAVPAYPPDPSRLNKSLPRLAAIVKDCDARFAFTSSKLKWLIKVFSFLPFEGSDILRKVRLIITDKIRLEKNLPAGFNLKKENIAFLQYTSGSTGNPKGVMLTNENILETTYAMAEKFATDSEIQTVFWVPFYHDMGLMGGVIQPLYCGASANLLSPLSFLRNPAIWLKAMSRYKATHTAVPNFALELTAKKATPESLPGVRLDSLKFILLGGEPVRKESMAKFYEAFAPFGFNYNAFYPAYGLAESTVLVSGGKFFSPPVIKTIDAEKLKQNRVVFNQDIQAAFSKDFVSCGFSPSRGMIKIARVDSPDECLPNQVGEIWVNGPYVGKGYWNKPELSTETFLAELPAYPGKTFLKTGDLGFFDENGELFITGRIKDLVIINGKNIYPQDIENTVEKNRSIHPEIRLGCCAVFSVEAKGTEQLVIFQELDISRPDPGKTREIAETIVNNIAGEHNVAVQAVVFLAKGALPKTSSGKVKRQACKMAFHSGDSSVKVIGRWAAPAGEYQPVTEKLPESLPETITPSETQVREASLTEIREWLTGYISREKQLDIREIDPKKSFAFFGFSSAEAVGLVSELAKWLNIPLQETILWDYPSIADLAAHLTGKSTFEKNNAKINAANDEPIAIVGIGCRFPGATGPDEFWQMLLNGTDTIREVPKDRWDIDRYYSPDLDKAKIYTRFGSFISEIDQFEPEFFNISGREAVSLDPQQRILLEVVYESLENASIPVNELEGSSTGVFVGISSADYSRFHINSGDIDAIDAYSGTGTAFSTAAGRISYTFGLHGPCMPVDTACSSSLVSVHLACNSLRNGECNLAIAGGVNLILSPEPSIYMCKLNALAPDGRCRSFDESASGYVRGEGAGAVILKRLSEAVRDKDHIYAVIRGSAVNQDGRSNGMMAPNGRAQQQVIRKALDSSGLTPQDISYIEAHGTGTPLGDPIEVSALNEALTKDRTGDNPLIVSSVKTNIGHLEAAAGIAGLIKTALAIRNRQIPGHLHLKKVNPRINHDKIIFPAGNLPWESENYFAGISSFGLSGTNAHLILSQAPEAIKTENTAGKPFQIFTLSAKNETALAGLAEKYCRFFAESGETLADLCYSANTGRTHYQNRLAIVAGTVSELSEKLAAYCQGKSCADFVSGNAGALKTAFLFPGQGSQYSGMAGQLYENEPVFMKNLDSCNEILLDYLEEQLLSVIFDQDNPLLHQTMYTQPALFAVEFSLARLWQSWGIKPDALIGHSVGEYAAACIAGVFSLADGLKLIAGRARLMQELPQNGRMLVVEAPETIVSGIINPKTVSIAAVNAGKSIVISGHTVAVNELQEYFSEKGIRTKALNVSHAFHSPLMDPVLEKFRALAETIKYREPEINLISNLTGKKLAEIPGPEYWTRHIRETVRFSDGLKELNDCGILLETGPGTTLAGLAGLNGIKAACLNSLKNNHPDQQQIFRSLGAIYAAGTDIVWQNLEKGSERKTVPLPTYSWQRQRYWVSQARKPDFSKNQPLLGKKINLSFSNEILYENRFSSESAILREHKVFDMVTMPAAAYLSLAIEAFAAEQGRAGCSVEGVSFLKPLLLTGKTEKTVQFVLSPGDQEYRFKILSTDFSEDKSNPDWTNHASGIIKEAGLPQNGRFSLEEIKLSFKNEVPAVKFINFPFNPGISRGPNFRWEQQIWTNGSEVLARLKEPDGFENSGLNLYPGLLDTCFNMLAFAGSENGIYVPFSLNKLNFYSRPAGDLWCYIKAGPETGTGREIYNADIILFGGDGEIAAEVNNLAVKKINKESFLKLAGQEEDFKDYLYQVSWQAKALREGARRTGRWLIVSNKKGMLHQLKLLLEQRKNTVSLADSAQCLDPGYIASLLLTEKISDIIYYGEPSFNRNEINSGSLTEQEKLCFNNVISIIKAAGQNKLKTKIWFITENSLPVTGREDINYSGSLLWGLGKVIDLEYPELQCTRIDTDNNPDKLLFELEFNNGDNEVALRESFRYVSRLKPFRPEKNDEYMVESLEIESRGTLENLKTGKTERKKPGPGQVEIKVAATGLNFRDILNVLGMYPGNPGPLGGECSGIITGVGENVKGFKAGDAVIAFTFGCFSSYVIAGADSVVLKPENISFEEAASIPAVFLKAHYALNHLVNIEPRD